ncbi:MAG: NAD(P)H-dependent flavin oxidoreductase [Haloechinothrix sp.]
MFSDLRVPIIVAPMAGGASTPELVAAASDAGALGFLAGGLLDTAGLADQINRTRHLTQAPFGVNLFVPRVPSDADTTDYRERMTVEAARYGTRPGEPTWDNDHYPEKLDVVVDSQIPIVSFTFQLPDAADVARIRAYGGSVITTVATPDEARAAAALGVDALCVQGLDAGGHRGALTDDGTQPAGGELYGVLAALRLISAEVELPLIAAGGLVHGADVAAVLVAGAVAAQLGTAFLRAEESGISGLYRDTLAAGGRSTALTRAFTGRPARGLVNRFLTEHSAHAPASYPQLQNVTKPIRAAAAAAADPEAVSIWAGQLYPLADDLPAAEIIERLLTQASVALDAARRRF